MFLGRNLRLPAFGEYSSLDFVFLDFLKNYWNFVKATIQSYTYFLGSIVPQQNELFPGNVLVLFCSIKG